MDPLFQFRSRRSAPDRRVRAVLEDIRQHGLDVLVPLTLGENGRLTHQLLARLRGRFIPAERPGEPRLVLLALSESDVFWGPPPGEAGHDGLLARALDAIFKAPLREPAPDPRSHQIIATMDRQERAAVERMIHAVAACQDPRQAASDEPAPNGALGFPVAGTPYQLGVRVVGAYAEIRVWDTRTVEERRAELAERFGGRVRISRAVKADIRRHLGDEEVREELEAFLASIAVAPLAPPEEDVSDAPPALWAIKNLLPAEAPSVAGLFETGALQAVVLIGRRGFELKLGFSTSTGPYWKLAVGLLDTERFRPTTGGPASGDYAPEVRDARIRNLAIIGLCGLQDIAAVWEFSQSGHLKDFIGSLEWSRWQLPVAALCIPLGQFASGLVARALLARGVKIRPLIIVSGFLFGGLWLASLAQPGAWSFPLVISGWLVFALGNGPGDAAIGAIADRLNEGARRPQFAALGMASYTVAGLLAGVVTSLLVARGVWITPHLFLVWMLSIVASVVVAVMVPNLGEEPVADARAVDKAAMRRLRVVMVVSGASLASLGGVLFYSSIVLGLLGASSFVASLGTPAFELAGMVVQITSFVIGRVRTRRIVLFGAASAFLGAAVIAFALYAAGVPQELRIAATLLAFTLLGAGLQLPPAVIPAAVGKMARRMRTSSAVAQTEVNIANYVGLGAGQAAQGMLSIVVSIPLAAALLFGACGAVMLWGYREVPR